MEKDYTASPCALSRRHILGTGLLTLGAAATAALPAHAQATASDVAILNAALDLEHQAIWAYGVAAGKLSDTPVGKTILTLALRNQADHKAHRDALAGAVKSFEKTPSPARSSYDLSSYIKAGEGNLDSDANIAKLALALEVDAALAYADAFSKLKTPAILSAAATIAPDESAHATAIRAVFKTLVPTMEYVPAPFLSAATRKAWILNV
ncbi:ferritin-like domain-containing protein [Anthocerotibacter panamensis]|uniref:ferritin-like domain-containing protein n=1 Tax=Anthocerotibacter panamensis TaxID=2857077 RepID=UPI001C40752C|nr:ferritin-like domain-containing protein [Anthocerotibacter panamensis]